MTYWTLNNSLSPLSDSSQENLKEAFESHRAETEGHVKRLHECFALLNENPEKTACRGVRNLIAEKSAFRKEDPSAGLRRSRSSWSKT